MTLLIVFAVIFAVFAFDSIFVVYVHRRAFGRFDITADRRRSLAFTSRTGSFDIRNDLGEIRCVIDGSELVWRFEEMERLELRVETRRAVLGEFLLDLDMEEHWKDERDYIEWKTISIVSKTGAVIQVYKSGKYFRKKYLHDFYTECQLAVLELCGLIVNVDDQCRDVLARLRIRLGSLPLSHCQMEM